MTSYLYLVECKLKSIYIIYANMKGNFIKAIDLKAARGQYKSCQLCSEKFGVLLKEHQCKRCKRAVCDKCAQHKIIILNYSKNKDPHRVCNACKTESDALKKFVDDNKIQFERDTLSTEWLQQFGLTLDIAKQQYKSERELKDPSEYNLFKGQLSSVYDEIQLLMNYSLRDFFYFALSKVDKSNILSTLDRVLGTFLQHFPEVGYAPELIFITLFLLCFASEASAYSLLTIIYSDIIPQQLHFRQMRLSNYDFKSEILQLSKIFSQLKVPFEPIKPFLQTLRTYMLPLSLNFFLFETSFFIISNIFTEDGYNEFLKCLASAFTQQDYSFTNDRIQLAVLQNVRLSSIQKVYYETKKFRNDGLPVRSMSVVQQKESELKQESEKIRNEMSTMQTQLQQAKLSIEAMASQITQLKLEIDLQKKETAKAKEMEKKLQGENNNLIEQNHNLKLQLLSESKDQSRLESTSKTLEASQDELLYQQYQQALKEKQLLEQQVVALKQENELLKGDKSQGASVQMTQLVKLKNEQIAKLQSELAEKDLKFKEAIHAAKAQEYVPQRHSSIAQINDVIKDLEDGKNLIEKKNVEILSLKRQIAEQQQALENSKRAQESQQLTGEGHHESTLQTKSDIELSDDLLLLLSDQDPSKRTAARNLKQQLLKIQEELIFQRTQAQIRREQLEPYRQKTESLQKQLELLVEQNKELQIEVEQKQDLLNECDRRPRKTIQGRMNLRDDKEILLENQTSCTAKKDCKMF